MVKPNKSQQARLDELRNLVIEIMTDMDVWQNHDLIPLFDLNLGVLKKTPRDTELLGGSRASARIS